MNHETITSEADNLFNAEFYFNLILLFMFHEIWFLKVESAKQLSQIQLSQTQV